MKKIFIFLLLVLCLVGCGKKKDFNNEENYIIKSKKTLYIEKIKNYISSAMVEVNSGSISIYNENILYLIPAGNDKNKSCLFLELGGESPYGDWSYLYIGVLYQDYSYNYYAIGEDEKGNGITFTKRDSLIGDIIYTGTKTKEDGYKILQELYNNLKETETYTQIDQRTNNYSKLSSILPVTNGKYNKIVVIGPSKCES